jgi:hypothetical protein
MRSSSRNVRGAGGPRRNQSDRTAVVRLGIDGGEQPALFVLGPTHQRIDRDLIWVRPVRAVGRSAGPTSRPWFGRERHRMHRGSGRHP